MSLEVNSIIQVKPEHEWGNCLLIVKEVKSFGCLAYAFIPQEDNIYYVRLAHEEFEVVGKAKYTVGDDE